MAADDQAAAQIRECGCPTHERLREILKEIEWSAGSSTRVVTLAREALSRV